MKARDYMIGGEHYKNMGIEPWDVLSTWPQAQQVGFYRGNALKYIMRAGSKGDPLQDIKKARHYLDRLIELLGEESATRIVTVSGVATGAREVSGHPERGEQDGAGGSSLEGLT